MVGLVVGCTKSELRARRRTNVEVQIKSPARPAGNRRRANRRRSGGDRIQGTRPRCPPQQQQRHQRSPQPRSVAVKEGPCACGSQVVMQCVVAILPSAQAEQHHQCRQQPGNILSSCRLARVVGIYALGSGEHKRYVRLPMETPVCARSSALFCTFFHFLCAGRLRTATLHCRVRELLLWLAPRRFQLPHRQRHHSPCSAVRIHLNAGAARRRINPVRHYFFAVVGENLHARPVHEEAQL